MFTIRQICNINFPFHPRSKIPATIKRRKEKEMRVVLSVAVYKKKLRNIPKNSKLSILNLYSNTSIYIILTVCKLSPLTLHRKAIVSNSYVPWVPLRAVLWPWTNLKRGTIINFIIIFSKNHDFEECQWLFSTSFQNLCFMSKILKDATVWGPLFHRGHWTAALKALALIWHWPF